MPRRKTSLRMWLNQESTAGYFFAAPFIIGFVVFIVVPMLMSLYFSFCDYNILSPAKWIGFENFKNLFNDPKFWKSLTMPSITGPWTLPIPPAPPSSPFRSLLPSIPDSSPPARPLKRRVSTPNTPTRISSLPV